MSALGARLETTVQQRVFWISTFSLGLSAVGLAVNSDFSTGDDLTSSWFLVDWNGWHALSGFLLWTPGVAAALISRPAAFAYGLGAIGAVTAPAIYTLFDKTPLGLLDFPNPTSDIIFHLTFAAILLWAVAPELRGRRSVGI